MNYTRSKETVNDFCSALNTASACVSSSGCLDNDRVAIEFWHGPRDGFSYLCNENGKAYLAIGQCFSDNKVYQSVVDCIGTFSLVSSKDNITYCRAMNDMLACASDKAKSCGRDAVTTGNTYMYKMYSPFAKEINCKLNMPAVAGATVLQGPSLLLIVLVSLVLTMRNRI